MLEVGLLDQMVVFWETSLFSTVAASVYIPSSANSSFFSASLPIFAICRLFDDSYSGMYEVVSHMILICISLIISELPDIQAGFRKGRGTRDQIANICWVMENAWEFQKNIYFCFIDQAKSFDFDSLLWITINCGKFWKRWENQTTWPASWETCMQVRKHQLELDMEQQTGSK